MENLLSERAKASSDYEDFLHEKLTICNNNPFDEKTNPSGFINLGTSVNFLCDDSTHQKLNDVWICDLPSLEYKDGRGTEKLRCAMAKMMSEFFESPEPLSADDLFCVTGVTSCIDLLAHCLADPGEVFLVPAPMYGRIPTDLMQRSQVEIYPVHMLTDDNEELVLTVEKMYSAYECALAANKVVRGVFLINPHNPLGDIYSPELLMDIMTFCSAKSLHFVVDEVYGLSVFSNTEKFYSILKFPQVPDPDRTHVLYGLSKDFALTGLRIGVIHTKCTQLQSSLKQLCFFQCIPYPVMHIVATLLEDIQWCREYVRLYRRRLRRNYTFCVKELKEMGIAVRVSHAGFFVWADFRELCGFTFEGEQDLFNFLMDNAKLYIGPGEEFYCNQPGWFRIVITQKHLKEGLKRLKEALEKYKPSTKRKQIVTK